MRIDTHRHLGGSIQIDWVWDTIKKLELKHLAETRDDVVKAMTFAKGEKRDFHRFLGKFKILDYIPWTEDLIASSIKSVCESLEKEGVDYCWMDFSINKYMEGPLTWHKHEAIAFIHDVFEQYRPGGVGLILSLKYEAPRASQRQYAELVHYKVVDRLFGIDLVGDEGEFDAEFYRPIFKEWNEAGKMTRAHVAESQSAENGRAAIEELKVTNIAHGLRMASNPRLMDLAKNHDVTFDLGICSNYYTGVWEDRLCHPVVNMLESGQKVTLGTDDPVQCSTDLDKEFENVRVNYGLSEDQCLSMVNVAIENTRKYAAA